MRAPLLLLLLALPVSAADFLDGQRITPARLVNQAATSAIEPATEGTLGTRGSEATLSTRATEATLAQILAALGSRTPAKTFTVVATNVAIGNLKSMLSILNADGSRVLRIHRVSLRNVQVSSVTGVAADFRLRRITGHSGGTLVTPEAHDTNDAIDADMTVRTGATVSGEAATFIDRAIWASDEWGPGTADVESLDHAMQQLTPGWDFTAFSALKPLVLRPGQGLTVKCETNSTAGTFDVVMVITDEAS